MLPKHFQPAKTCWQKQFCHQRRLSIAVDLGRIGFKQQLFHMMQKDVFDSIEGMRIIFDTKKGKRVINCSLHGQLTRVFAKIEMPNHKMGLSNKA